MAHPRLAPVAAAIAVLMFGTLMFGMLSGCASARPTASASTPAGRANAPTPSAHAMEEAASRGSSAVGLMAPDFTALDQSEKPVRLSDFRGRWVVMYFYPKDDTPGCVCEATEFTDILWEFHALDSVVIGVSPDSPADHRRFAKKYGLAVQLLSDPEKRMMRKYGAWVDTLIGSKRVGRVVRSTYILAPNGRIAWHWPEVIPQGHAERVRDRLRQLRAAAAR